MDNHRAVVITGMGVCSPIGTDVEQVAAALAQARSAIVPIRVPPLTASYPGATIAARLAGGFSSLELPYLDRCQQLAILAAGQAIADAGCGDLSAAGERAGIYYGNVNGGAATEQLCYEHILLQSGQAMRPFWGMSVMRNGGAAQISIRHRVRGPVLTYGSACAASGVAIGEAARAIRAGHLDIVVAGGAEAPLTAALMATFDGARVLAPLDAGDPARSCKPFSRQRRGLVLGEGAAFFILEDERRARRRGARCHARLSGYGVGADAHHVGMPCKLGMARTIRAALADAGLAPAQIDYLNAHATATVNGDLAEAEAIVDVFGAAPAGPRVSSTKSIHGHLLGAASAMELLCTVVAMNRRLVPATAHLDEADPLCRLNHVAGRPLPGMAVRHAMSVSAGFGGTNTALVVSACEPGGDEAVDA
jgi:3-oxoacyl-[acyl-carrier-protein] synthase II